MSAGCAVTVRLRPPRPDEATALTALALRSKAHWGYDDAFMRRCAPELTVTAARLAAGLAAVLEAEGAVQGFYLLEPVDETTLDVALFFVEPAALGHGFGRALLDHACAAAQARGCRMLVIESDPHAEGFYLRCGARRTGTAPSGSIPGRQLPVLALAVG